MAIKYHWDLQQGTEEWFKIKLGVVSASKVSDMMTAKGEIANNKTSRRYATEIAAERILGFKEASRSSYDMWRGTMQEPIAREIYDDNCDKTKECGFVTSEYLGIPIGVSPDGLVDHDGGIEIKSKIAVFQLQTILSGEVPAEHINQIQTFLLVTGRKWCDYVQYSNALPLFVCRVYPDEVRREQILRALGAFEEVVQEIIDEYQLKASAMIQTEKVDWEGMDMITASEESE